MRKLSIGRSLGIRVAIVAAVVGLCGIHVPQAKAAGAFCYPTGFMRDNINLTAAAINPSGVFSGTVNATGCNIGVYYGPGTTGVVAFAQIYGANYFGVVNNGANVTLYANRIHDIGESPFNGDQHGVGIYFAYASGATGKILANTIWKYQKGGIAVTGSGNSATISYNTIFGLGPVNFIAQNGIEIGGGATGSAQFNNVYGNSYTGDGLTSSGGVLLYGGSCYGDPISTNVVFANNVVLGNDVGVWLSDLDVDPNNPNNCVTTATPTRNVVYATIASNDAVNNTSGYGTVGAGYQAGIADQGSYDTLVNNSTCGAGYTPVASPPPYLYMIDVTTALTPTLANNSSCSPGSSAAIQATRGPGARHGAPSVFK